jgi:hypothetical protein
MIGVFLIDGDELNESDHEFWNELGWRMIV